MFRLCNLISTICMAIILIAVPVISCQLATPGAGGIPATPTIYPPGDIGNLFLPLIIQPAYTQVGVQLLNSENNGIVVPGSIVMTAIKWSDVESQPGLYIWPHLWLDNYQVILQVKAAPEWARGEGSKLCAPPTPENLERFIDFAVAAVNNYRGVFGDKLLGVAIWNEPDVPSILAPDQNVYGCIDNVELYVAMVSGVYDRLRGQGNTTPVIAGEFMLAKTPHRYIETFLSLADDKFDILSFHRYEWDISTQGTVDRVSYLRQFTNKPLALTETSLLCETPRQECGEEFELQQRDYLLQITQVTDLQWVIWYTGEINCWRNSDLLRCDGTIKTPLWCTYITLTQQATNLPSLCDSYIPPYQERKP